MMRASGMKYVWQGGEGGITSARPGAADASGFRLKTRQPSRGAIRQGLEGLQAAGAQRRVQQCSRKGPLLPPV